MICKLAQVGCGCKDITEDGHCTFHLDEGVKRNMEKGSCVRRNIFAPNIGIYETKKGRLGRVGQQKQKKIR